jgi:multidrug efflux pump subunit AcrB
MMNLGLIVFGLIGLSRLPVRELPDVDPPIVNVTTVYTGAGSAVIESQITEPLEESLSSIEGIRTLTSESRDQTSHITLEFDLAHPIDVAAQDMRDRVSRVRGRLPDGIEEPIVAKQDADAHPVMWVALYSDRLSTLELTTLAERQIKDSLQAVPGVSQVIIGGAKPAMPYHGPLPLLIRRQLHAQASDQRSLASTSHQPLLFLLLRRRRLH